MIPRLLGRALDLLYDAQVTEAISLLRTGADDLYLALLADLLDPDPKIKIPNKLVLKQRRRGRAIVSLGEKLDRRFAAYDAVHERKPGTKVLDAISDHAAATKRSPSAVRADYRAVKILKMKMPKKTSNKLT